jgi:hypothetical protein
MTTMTDEDTHTLPSIDDHAAQFTRELLGQAIALAARDRAQAAAGMIEVRDLAQRIQSMTTEVDRAKNDAKSYHAVETVLAKVRGEARPDTPASELIAKIIDQRQAYYGFMNEAKDNAQAITRDRDTAMTLMRLRDDSYPTCEESARSLIAKFDQVTEHGRRAAADLAKVRAELDGYREQLGVETERLAKLESKLRERDAKHPSEPERCPVCNWTNSKLMNYGVVGEPRWMCHGCAARTIQGVESRPWGTGIADGTPRVDIAAVMRDGVGPDAAPAGTPTADTDLPRNLALTDACPVALPAYGPMEVLTSERLAEALDFSGAMVKEGEPRVPQIRSIANAVMRYLVPSTLPAQDQAGALLRGYFAEYATINSMQRANDFSWHPTACNGMRMQQVGAAMQEIAMSRAIAKLGSPAGTPTMPRDLALTAASLLRKISRAGLAQGGDQSPNAEECIDMAARLESSVGAVCKSGTDRG